MSKELAASLVITCSIVAGIYYLVEEESARKAADLAVKESPGSLSSIQSSDLPAPLPVFNQKENQSEIVKCSIRGGTVYSNEPCDDGRAGQKVKIAESSGIVTPPREVVNSTMARAERQRQIELAQSANQVKTSLIGKSPEVKYECDSLQKRIEHLESMARMPQHPQTQDWITQDKRQAIDRQNSLKC